jgi:hypothetical protein
VANGLWPNLGSKGSHAMIVVDRGKVVTGHGVF